MLRVSERIVDQDAESILDGYGILAVTWPEEALRDQGFDFIRPDLDLNDSLTPPLSLAVTAHAIRG